jgi:hypothetical protein
MPSSCGTSDVIAFGFPLGLGLPVIHLWVQPGYGDQWSAEAQPGVTAGQGGACPIE